MRYDQKVQRLFLLHTNGSLHSHEHVEVWGTLTSENSSLHRLIIINTRVKLELCPVDTSLEINATRF